MSYKVLQFIFQYDFFWTFFRYGLDLKWWCLHNFALTLSRPYTMTVWASQHGFFRLVSRPVFPLSPEKFSQILINNLELCSTKIFHQRKYNYCTNRSRKSQDWNRRRQSCRSLSQNSKRQSEKYLREADPRESNQSKETKTNSFKTPLIPLLYWLG